MAAGEEAAPPRNRTGGDVLHLLRTGTEAEHESVERTLDLLDPALDRARLAGVLVRMHGFWQAAEAGLDDWAGRFPSDAQAVSWSARCRADLFAADLVTLGATPADAAPQLPTVTDTDDALGRLYVLEGSTLGGTFIDRHLTGLPALSGVRLRAFSPYGPDTGAMWHAFRRVTRDRVTAGGDADRMLAAATGTFRAMAQWCRPAGVTA
jgi:heme oxygenase (biliverdin-IX-beta and delta-forming)